MGKQYSKHPAIRTQWLRVIEQRVADMAADEARRTMRADIRSALTRAGFSGESLDGATTFAMIAGMGCPVCHEGGTYCPNGEIDPEGMAGHILSQHCA